MLLSLQLNAKTFPLAVSEPLGGGLFVSNVVVAIIIFLAGKNGVVLGKAAFLRDTGFYSVALILVFSFVIDGKVGLHSKGFASCWITALSFGC